MKRILTAKQVRRIKFMCSSFVSLIMLVFLADKVVGQDTRAAYGGPYYWQGKEYNQFKRVITPSGYVDEYTSREAGFCRSFILPLGISLENDYLMGGLYLVFMGYMFVGIAIVSDIFMEAIEVITAQTRMVVYVDSFGKDLQYEETIWNPTIANLSLMALGSSAPEILLSVYETLMYINTTPGELGPSTIVGSAAFNLLIITAVSIMAVSEVKKIDDVGVFVITSIASLFAYVWMYITLKVWTPEYITVLEALLTLFFFFALIGCSYAADRCRNRYLKAQRTDEEKQELEKEKIRLVNKAQLRQIANQYGQAFVIECVTGGSLIAGEDRIQIRDQVRQAYRIVLGIQDQPDTDLAEIPLAQLISALEKENLIDRLAHRRMAGTGMKKDYVKIKGTHNQFDHKSQGQLMNPNPRIGFKCTHYSVTESSGHVTITIVKKVQEEMMFFVRTKDDTAKVGADYDPISQVITMGAKENEKTINVGIKDDDIWEPDKDFHIEICENEAGPRMEGDDTLCVVTILDEDQPGNIGFQDKLMKVRRKDNIVYVKVVRTDGADGEISCWAQTVKVDGIPNAAQEFADFCPIEEKLTFAHQETEKIIKIELIQTASQPGEIKEGESPNGDEADDAPKKERDQPLIEQVDPDNAGDPDKRPDSAGGLSSHMGSAMSSRGGDDSESEAEEGKALLFNIKLDRPEPKGTALSKKSNICVHIQPDEDLIQKEDYLQQKMLEYIIQQREATWLQQFKYAVMLGPSIDEENTYDDVTGKEALVHFISIGWNVLFAFIPPRRYCHGWPAFFIALGMIGGCTAIVGEVANLLGCVIYLRQAVTAITLVALGTSLPDTFASKIAAENSDNADSAIGNITGSNSVNVFLGLGLPWTMATIYRKQTTGEDYAVPSGTLAYSVMLFLMTAVVCFIILAIRRCAFGGELGGPRIAQIISAVILVMLWSLYILFSTLQAYEFIEGF